MSFWRTRLSKIGKWLAAHEKDWQKDWSPAAFEKEGQIEIHGTVPFTLKARIDRIDVARDGEKKAALIDYKSAGSFSQSGLKAGSLPQLPLEGLILNGGGFETALQTVPHYIDTLGYLIVNGAKEGGLKVAISGDETAQAVKSVSAQLHRLIDLFYGINPAPYIALPNASRLPRYNDYAHLERAAEWASLEGEEEAA